MLILLSSTKRERYRNDILRCLAGPEGTVVRFRYSEEIVDSATVALAGAQCRQYALVCSVDLDEKSGVCPLVPVRSVKVRDIRHQGKTVVIEMELGMFVAASGSAKAFASEVASRCRGSSPVYCRDGSGRDVLAGKFCFECEDEVPFRQSNSISTWEEAATQLLAQPGFQDEQFVWTVMGLRGPGDPVPHPQSLLPWKSHLVFDEDYELDVYVFHPARDAWKPKVGFLSFATDPPVQVNQPHDVRIDSPYDVKRWRFRIPRTQERASRHGWMQIGPRTDRGAGAPSEPEWFVDLPIEVIYPRGKFFFEIMLQGSLLAIPGIASVFIQDAKPIETRLVVSFGLVLAGLLAAYFARVGLKKPF